MGSRSNKPRRPSAAPPGGWPKRGKTPSIGEPAASTVKTPRALYIDDPDAGERHPVWRFADHDDEGTHTLGNLDGTGLIGLISKLRSFESMKINEIFAVGSEHGKSYPVEDLPTSVQKRLTALGRDDETEVARLRCGGKPRLYGFLRENVFHVLWWDPEHQVYPSKKRNT